MGSGNHQSGTGQTVSSKILEETEGCYSETMIFNFMKIVRGKQNTKTYCLPYQETVAKLKTKAIVYEYS